MYTVTRQIQFSDGVMMVEISAGGFDNVNSDMLVERYDHEGETFIDPRDALNAAIDIHNKWCMDKPDEDIGIGYGETFGGTAPFDVSDVEDMIMWAQKEYEYLDKCDRCGDILPEEFYFIGDMRYCSENCAERDMDDMTKEED